MIMPTTQFYLSKVKLYDLAIPRAKGPVVAREAYKLKVADDQVRLEALGLPDGKQSQDGMIEFLRRYNDENKLTGNNRIRPASPDVENIVAKLGYQHEAFDNQFERRGKSYVDALTDTQLRKPGQKSYKEGTSEKPFWRRDEWKFDFDKGLWVKFAEGRRIEQDGVILEKDPTDGLPTKTTGSHEHGAERKEHWYFDSDLDEVALRRGGQAGLCNARYADRDDYSAVCLRLDANLQPIYSGGKLGFRPVSGPPALFKSVKPA